MSNFQEAIKELEAEMEREKEKLCEFDINRPQDRQDKRCKLCYINGLREAMNIMTKHYYKPEWKEVK